MNESFLDKKLNERKNIHALRELRIHEGMIDFCSNDYLGIANNNLLHQNIHTHFKSGAGGSRLLAGNYVLIELAEKKIAAFHEAEQALIFNSGYDANLGVLSSIPQKNDIVLYDRLSHASIRDGIRLSLAQAFSFEHNNIADLSKKLEQHFSREKNIFIVTESVFSMDGDICPLREILDVCETYHAHLILDEAHATGILGANGEGLAQALQQHKKIFCRVHTFGKACGCHGAVVLGSEKMKKFLINFARSFIYTTALPEATVQAIIESYTIFPFLHKERKHLHTLIEKFQRAEIKYKKLSSNTPIQIVIIPGNDNVKSAAAGLQAMNYDVRAIMYPTVPKEEERLRIVLHSFNTAEEINNLTSLLQ